MTDDELLEATTDALLARRIAAAFFLHGVTIDELEQVFSKPKFATLTDEIKQAIYSKFRLFHQGTVITPTLEQLARLNEPPTTVWVVSGAVVTAKLTREEAVVAAIGEGEWKQVSDNRWESRDDFVEITEVNL